MTARLDNQNQIEPLTPREVEVLYLLFRFELDPSEIACQLSISKRTLDNHVCSIYGKLSVTSRAEAVHAFAQVDPPYLAAYVAFLTSQNK